MFRPKRPSATSLPQSPRDDESSRIRKYLVTMGIRVLCLVLMVVVQPYSWYTWLFGLGAAVLPYVAVVLANVGKDAHETQPERPELSLPAQPGSGTPAEPKVIRVAEAPRLTDQPHDGVAGPAPEHPDGDRT
ncbi:DUF3099 domain-containing protein [Microbacterium sp.]|uniref:DUF3099 domain-containing protein n=1 Tax=Microbacterium sp. TaxID=51671 RepID=UPI0037C82CE1